MDLTTPELDRCDKCGAPAQVNTIFESGQDLQFCEEHWQAAAPALSALAVEVRTEQPVRFLHRPIGR